MPLVGAAAIELQHKDLIASAKWPVFDKNKLTSENVDIIVQMNGKFRGKITVPKDAGQKEVEQKVLEDPQLKKYLENNVKKVIFISNRLINFVLTLNP